MRSMYHHVHVAIYHHTSNVTIERLYALSRYAAVLGLQCAFVPYSARINDPHESRGSGWVRPIP